MSFDYQTLATQFVQHYYQQFETNRSSLLHLYRDDSMLTFETNQVAGASNIIEKLVSLPFQKVRHEIATLDSQPGSPGGRDVIVLVTGQLLIDEEENPQRYTQTFHLLPEGDSYYVYNDLFRLVM